MYALFGISVNCLVIFTERKQMHCTYKFKGF